MICQMQFQFLVVENPTLTGLSVLCDLHIMSKRGRFFIAVKNVYSMFLLLNFSVSQEIPFSLVQ